MNLFLKQVFIGKPKTIGEKGAPNIMDREWTSAIFKQPVEGPIWAGNTNLVGDGQADLKNHGGQEKAIFVYPYEHYAHWQKELNSTKIGPGGMGENFSVNFTEEKIAIGDTFQIGDAVVQVSQPRQPCWKPARRFRVKELALLIQDSGRTGWYFRVLKEGYVEEGQVLTLIDRPHPKWTIQKCNEVMHVDQKNLAAAKELAECELLAVNWRKTLTNRVEKGVFPNINTRVIGPNE